MKMQASIWCCLDVALLHIITPSPFPFWCNRHKIPLLIAIELEMMSETQNDINWLLTCFNKQTNGIQLPLFWLSFNTEKFCFKYERIDEALPSFVLRSIMPYKNTYLKEHLLQGCARTEIFNQTPKKCHFSRKTVKLPINRAIKQGENFSAHPIFYWNLTDWTLKC